MELGLRTSALLGCHATPPGCSCQYKLLAKQPNIKLKNQATIARQALAWVYEGLFLDSWSHVDLQ